MKILILSCNTGGGHNTAAKAIKEVLDERNIDCEVTDALALSSQLASDLVCNSYIEMVKRTPKLFGDLYHAGERIGSWNKIGLKTPIYAVNTVYASEIKNYITKNNFDAVVSTHIFPAQALTHLYRHDKLNIPAFFVVTDYSCTPMLEDTEHLTIFVPHKDVLSDFISHGIAENRLVCTGIPVSKRFAIPRDKEGSREKLGIHKDNTAILIMSGSMGFGDSIKTTATILKLSHPETKIMILTGNNKKLQNEFAKRFPDNPQVIVVPFTDQVPMYMDASDVMLSKPGGLSTTEAAVKNLPLIHTNPIPGCETLNAKFFSEHHMSVLAYTADQAANLAIKITTDSFLRNQIRDAQKHYINPNSARDITDYILGHIN